MKIKTIQIKEGTILLDAINEAGIKNISVFGICDKQLSCHSCAVNIISNNNLELPSEEELDVLSELKGNKYNEKTRMSCQIILNKKCHNDLKVEVFESELFN